MRRISGFSRRRFLTGLGALIALPRFPSLFPAAAGASAANDAKPPTRLMFMCVPLGFVPNKSLFDCPMFQAAGATGWLPDQDGALVTMPDVHASLQPYCSHISFLKGLSNRKYRADVHRSDDAFLTCADTLSDPSKAATNTISCDQVAAGSEAMGGDAVRYRSLCLGGTDYFGSCTGGLSWVENGVPVSPIRSPAHAFDALFGRDDVPAEARLQRLQQKRSVLDVTLVQIKQMNRMLNAVDRAKLDEVVTAVRGVERSIQSEQKWLNIDKPKASILRPDEAIKANSSSHARTMFALAHAAFLTDSTRVITYELPSSYMEISPHDKHALNHDLTPETAADAPKVDRAMSDELARFTKLLCDTQEHDGQPLIQHMLAVYGAAVWGPNHCLNHLPIMLLGHGGGTIKQGTTRRYDEHTPLANLWLTMLEVAGVQAPGGAFADSTGVLTDLT